MWFSPKYTTPKESTGTFSHLADSDQPSKNNVWQAAIPPSYFTFAIINNTNMTCEQTFEVGSILE